MNHEGIENFTINAGQFAAMILSYVGDLPAVIQPVGKYLKKLTEDTIDEWQTWAENGIILGAFYKFI